MNNGLQRRLRVLMLLVFTLAAYGAGGKDAQADSQVNSAQAAATVPPTSLLTANTGGPQALAVYGRGYLTDIAWSPDGATLAVATSIGIWHYDDLAAAPTLLASSRYPVERIAFSPDGSRLLACGDDAQYNGEIVVWDHAGGSVVLTIPSGNVNACTWSPDAQFIVSGNDFGNLIVWDAHSGAEVRRIAGMENNIYDLAFTADKTRLAGMGLDEHVRVWALATGEMVADLTGFTNSFRNLTVQGAQALTGDNDTLLWRWALAGSRETPLEFTTTHCACALAAGRLTPDGAAVLATTSFRVWLLDAATGDLIVEMQAPQTARTVNDLALSPDGRRLAVAYREGGAGYVYEVATGAGRQGGCSGV